MDFKNRNLTLESCLKDLRADNNSEGTLYNNSLYCSNLTDLLNTYWFVVRGIGITVIAILGIIGNILSSWILLKPQLRCSISFLLLGLTISDIFICINTLFRYGLYGIFSYLNNANSYRNIFYPVVTFFLLPIGFTARTASVYFTMMITFDRFVAVCHPFHFHARRLLKQSSVVAASSLVIIFSIVYNIPKWLEQYVEYNPEKAIYQLGKSDLVKNSTYKKIYRAWGFFIVMYFIPFITLLVFNVAIYRKMRSLQIIKGALFAKEKEDSMTNLLFAVVITFFICNILAGLRNLVENFHKTGANHHKIYAITVPISNFLLTLNSSINCLLYCGFGKTFRHEFCKMLKPLAPKRIMNAFEQRYKINVVINEDVGQQETEEHEMSSQSNTNTTL